MLPVYTWNTPKGNLSFCPGGPPVLQLTTRNASVVNITHVQGELDVFEVAPNRIVEICSQYLAVVKQTGTSGSFSVTFHRSAFPGDFVPEDQEEQEKSFGFDFNALQTERFIQFSSTAPAYRRVVRGASLHGTCQQAGCAAQNKEVCVPLGMGTFNIPEKIYEAPCPSCDHNLDADTVKNIGFWDCDYTIKGVREKKPVEENSTAPHDKYKTFQPNEESTWQFLTITTAPILKPQPQQQASSGGGCNLF